MKKLLIEIWLGTVSRLYPDPNNEAKPEEQREAQAATLAMIAFIALLSYAYWKGWLR